jgi:hypothetical protein
MQIWLNPDQRPVNISWLAFSAGGCGGTGATTEDSERGVGQRVNFLAGFSIQLSHRKAGAPDRFCEWFAVAIFIGWPMAIKNALR